MTALLAMGASSGLFGKDLLAQSGPGSHALTLTAASETVDARQRRIVVAKVVGDLPGVLTLAVQLAPDGSITGGEWALNVSYIRFGPPDKDGDGDASEYLVQRGVLKGTIYGGAGTLAAGGLLQSLQGLQLSLTGATLDFAAVKSGGGTMVASGLAQPDTSRGLLTLNF